MPDTKVTSVLEFAVLTQIYSISYDSLLLPLSFQLYCLVKGPATNEEVSLAFGNFFTFRDFLAISARLFMNKLEVDVLPFVIAS